MSLSRFAKNSIVTLSMSGTEVYDLLRSEAVGLGHVPEFNYVIASDGTTYPLKYIRLEQNNCYDEETDSYEDTSEVVVAVEDAVMYIPWWHMDNYYFVLQK